MTGQGQGYLSERLNLDVLVLCQVALNGFRLFTNQREFFWILEI